MGLEIEEQFAADFAKFCLTHPGVVLHLSAVQAWSLMAGLQLACRHPEWHGATRDIVESIARMLEEALATTPALREIAKMGWRPECDVREVRGE